MLSVVLLAVLLAPARPALAQSQAERLEEMIELEKERASQQQEEIRSLEQRQRSLKGELSRVEARVERLASEVVQKQAELSEVRAREEATRAGYVDIRQRQQALLEDLRGLLAAIWPFHSRGLQSRLGRLENWRSADRAFTWLAEIYRVTQDKLTQVVQAAVELRENLAEQRRLAQQAEARLGEVNALKDQLLRDRLALRTNLGRVSEEKVDLQAELKDILGVIQELNYQLGSQATKRFPDNKQLLPWPADGRVVARFSPSGNPPSRGLGLSLAQDEPVRSVFWGKVVHNDVLRGFGRVVIVYHGDEYYSLYAYLSEATPLAGQEVEKDEPIGRAGFYPVADGPGLYFELRFGGKPINPLGWLSPK